MYHFYYYYFEEYIKKIMFFLWCHFTQPCGLKTLENKMDKNVSAFAGDNVQLIAALYSCQHIFEIRVIDTCTS